MITYIQGDITKVDHGIVAHGVNCQGAMGSGVAKAIKEKWPKVYDEFKSEPTGRTMLGQARLIKVAPKIWVANCYTQLYYGRDGRKYASADAIEQSLETVCALAENLGYPVHLPKIGAGLGGLDWETEVLPVIKRVAEKSNTIVYVYEF